MEVDAPSSKRKPSSLAPSAAEEQVVPEKQRVRITEVLEVFLGTHLNLGVLNKYNFLKSPQPPSSPQPRKLSAKSEVLIVIIVRAYEL
jgi:hypothetical protein